MMLSQRENAESVQILDFDWIQHKDTTYNNDIPSTTPSRLQSDLSRLRETLCKVKVNVYVGVWRSGDVMLFLDWTGLDQSRCSNRVSRDINA